MIGKIRLQQALIEAKASIRLAGLPISHRDDDLYASVIEGRLSGPLRDIVLARIRAELTDRADRSKPDVRSPDNAALPLPLAPFRTGSE